jgi:hypothetical protein
MNVDQLDDNPRTGQMFRRDLAEGSAARAEVIARFRRLEADLAKCRTYFGAKAFDEATKAAP